MGDYLVAFRCIASEIHKIVTGAGEGNRTLIISLEGCCSTIELHPRKIHFTLHRRPINLTNKGLDNRMLVVGVGFEPT
jgi:hypothetical protein